ncbi:MULTISPECIES: methyl-accepting chemotaxis protein [unclassified Sphingosinithalassobacter]|uniref:methyl-accepting chemotaxis protein n=1 Tax=unclassified Sphingosinithalassobacter TaxID=2676235 RepID=UPI00165E911A|nr:methyl-accepting chemotaxis protein [Sphingosinithalassobacter sp. CS137]
MLHTALAPEPAESRRPLPGSWLTDAERDPPSLSLDGTLFDAVDVFHRDTDLRLVPVLDSERRPVGAVFEKDVRRLLLNPFGHALLRNPAYGRGIARHVRPCPTAEVTQDVGALIDAYRESSGAEGMILTHGGRLFGVITNRRLVHIAAERELRSARTRIARAQRIERASERFEGQVQSVGEAMTRLAELVQRNAGATAERAQMAGDHATAVASAASQTSQNMGEIAERGRELAVSLGRIGRSTRETETAAADALALVSTGSARARELLDSAQSIDSVIALISEIARQVNLLALNATIEAARAGEAGRGFTVVANEVKQLSTQTGNAAERITAHVREIRHGIDEVAAGQESVERAIATMAALAGDVQGAVGVQENATRTIALNVDEVVEATNAIHRDVEAIGGTSRAASDSAHEMQELADRLLVDASQLSHQVAAFLDEIREA